MLHFPKIPGSRNAPNGRCVAFEKYDGTNLHWDWDRDFGWHAFGTRRDQFNFTPNGIDEFTDRHEHLNEAPGVFLDGLATKIDEVLRTAVLFNGVQEVKAFTEFLGPNSFAGLHRSDDPKELRLIDVEIVGFGFVDPDEFVRDFAGPNIARVVYRGRLTGQFAEDVRTGKYAVAEGVVCKGGEGPDRWMVKIKTYAYLERLKQAFGERWEEFWE